MERRVGLGGLALRLLKATPGIGKVLKEQEKELLQEVTKREGRLRQDLALDLQNLNRIPPLPLREALAADELDTQGSRKGVIRGTTLGGMQTTKLIDADKDRIYMARWAVHSWTRASVSKIAKACSRAEALIRPAEGVKDPDPRNKKALENLLLHPNPRQPLWFMLYISVTRLKVLGEEYWEIVYDDEGLASYLYTLEGNVQPHIDAHGYLKDPVAYTQNLLSQQKVEFSSDEVIEFLMPNPEGGIHGASDLEALQIVIPTDLRMSQWEQQFFLNGTKPPGLWVLKDTKNPKMVARNKEEIRAAALAANKGQSSPAVIEGEVDYHPMDTSMKDADFREGRKDYRAETAAVIGTPLGKLGATERLNRSNMSEQNRNFYEDEVDFNLAIVDAGINAMAKEHWGIEDWVVRFSSGIHLSPSDRSELIKAGKGYQTINEVRTKILNLPRIKGGDIILVQTAEGMRPLSEVITTETGEVETFEEKEEDESTKAELEVSKTESETKEGAGTSLHHDHGCEHDTREELGPLSFPNELMRPAEGLAKNWQAALERAFFKMRDRLLTKLREAYREKKDYRPLAETPNPLAFSKINVEFMKQAFVKGQQIVAFNGPEDPTIEAGLVDPEDLDRLEKLAKERPLFQIDWEIVPKSEWEILRKKASKISNGTVKRLVEGDKTGRAHLKQILEDGWKQGLRLEELEGNIRSLFRDFSSWQARRIARSETNPIYNVARIEASEKAGYKDGRVITGPRACEQCRQKANETLQKPQPLSELKSWILTTHPNESCVIVAVAEGVDPRKRITSDKIRTRKARAKKPTPENPDTVTAEETEKVNAIIERHSDKSGGDRMLAIAEDLREELRSSVVKARGGKKPVPFSKNVTVDSAKLKRVSRRNGTEDLFADFNKAIDIYEKNCADSLWDGKPLMNATYQRKRAFYDPAHVKGFPGGTLNTGWNKYGSQVSDISHELGHYVEWQNPRVKKAVLDFYDVRTKGESFRSLRFDTGLGYRLNEKYKKDKWYIDYMGKWNGGIMTELLPIGSQYFLGPFEEINLAKWAIADPEHCGLVMGILKGRI